MPEAYVFLSLILLSACAMMQENTPISANEPNKKVELATREKFESVVKSLRPDKECRHQAKVRSGRYEAELRYLMEHEWAYTPEDVLWRRTKLGLYFNPQAVQNLTDIMNQFEKDPSLQRVVS